MMYGVAGFIDGVFKGMDWREGRDSRKRQREIGDERLGRERDAHEWARQNQQWIGDERARRRKREDRAESDELAERDAYRRAYDATQQGAVQAATEAQNSPTAPSVSTQPAIEAPASSARRAPEIALSMGQSIPVNPSAIPEGRREAIEAGRDGRAAAPVYTYEDWRGMSRAERESSDLPVSEIGGQMYFDRFAAGLGGEPARRAGRADQAGYDADARARRSRELDAIIQNAPLPQGVADPRAAMADPDARADDARRVQESAFVGATGTPGLAFTQGSSGQPEVQTAEATPAPSVEIAAQSAGRATRERRAGPNITGTNMPIRATEQQRTRGATDFLENYARTGAPLVVEHYLKSGQPQKAQAFQQFIDERQTKDAMRHWARAAHAAAIGDDEGFASAIAKAYNSAGYYDDGISVVEDETRFINDESGSITGGVITFRNEDTGETFQQQLNGREEIYRLGLGMLAPETVFEEGWKRVEEARAARGAQSQAAFQKEARANDPEAIAKAIKTLSESNLNFASLPIEEQMRLAVEFVRDPRSAAGVGGTDQDIPFLP